MKATVNGKLRKVPDCYIVIPSSGGAQRIVLNNLPDIGDSKGASYANESIIGRSFPMYTYSNSTDRQISMQLHFFVITPSDIETNMRYLRLIQSAVYPREGGPSGAPFRPPPICRIKCGELLAKSELCVVLQSYNVRFPTDVAWISPEGNNGKFIPFRFDVDTSWLVVYPSRDLPFQNRIIVSGR